AEWFEEQHKTVDALDHLQYAFDQLERCGATRDLARVRARLRAHGVRRRRDSHRLSSGWEGLTDSERTVVDLVVDGLTSREAAQRFSLPHTPDTPPLRPASTRRGAPPRHELIRLALTSRRPTEPWPQATPDSP